MRGVLKAFWLAGSTLVLLEAALRATGLDMRLLRPLLYYQQAIPDLHEPSSDPELIYRLRPSARSVFAGASFRVNSLGFRDPPRAARKEPGVVRVVCLGASYMFGALVDDGESLPRRLEVLLNRHFQGRFEVWNAGVSAYNVRQEAAYARTIEREYEPDLMIFHLNAAGRRAFLPGQPSPRHFRADPGLYLENLAWVPLRGSLWGARRMAASPVYRTAVIARNRLGPAREPAPEYTDGLCLRAWSAYLADSRAGPPKALVVLSGGPVWGEALPLVRLYRGPHVPARLPPEYFLIHPPAHVYGMQAVTLALRLAEEFPGLLRWKPGRRAIPAASLAPVPFRLDARQAEESARAGRAGPVGAGSPAAPTAPPRVPQADPVLEQAARYCDRGEEEKALAVLAASSAPQARHRTALILQRLGRLPEAIALLEGLARAEPGTAVYLKDLAICEHLAGRTKDAVRDLERALRLDPGLLAATQSLGTILQARGNRAEALRLYRRALGLPAAAGGERLRAQIRDSARALEKEARR